MLPRYENVNHVGVCVDCCLKLCTFLYLLPTAVRVYLALVQAQNEHDSSNVRSLWYFTAVSVMKASYTLIEKAY